jgi:CheY-like chemotaxis protein
MPEEVGGSGTVLLVEDNPDVASVSSNLLEQLGYTVRRVADAETALREVENAEFDLVFSDIVMPGRIDGLHLARRLREIRPDLPILLATGYSDAAAGVRGDFPILRKPYEIHELSQAIANLPR